MASKFLKIAALGLAASFGMTAAANAAVIDWVDWTSAGAGGTAAGTLAGGAVAVNYTGGYQFVQTGVGTNFWSEGNPAPYTASSVVDNAPTAAELIALTTAGRHTVTFSQAVLNPIFAFNSWNGGNQSIDFGTPITILSTGLGYWGQGTIVSAYGGNGFSTTGGEPHGALQLMGSFTSITFIDTQNENWHGFTFGIEGLAPNEVPEPAALGLFGLGLAGLSFAARRRKAG